jgi:hypothetical protein
MFFCVGLRGITANIVILEEAAFISPALFYEVIAPLLGVERTVVLAISTPDESEDNYYSRLMDIKDPMEENAPLFKTIRIGLACDTCVSNNQASQCTHKQKLVPPWKSSRRQDKMRKIMAADKHLFMRENLGMISNSTQFMFPPHMVKRLHDATPFQFSRKCNLLYCAIDPSGGGTQSDYAVSTICVEKGEHVIVGLDHSDSGSIEVRV